MGLIRCGTGDGERAVPIVVNCSVVLFNRVATLLACVCVKGHTACARLLIKRGAAVDQRELFHGGSPLHHAVSMGHTGCAQVLISARASLNALAEDGTTPLIMAAVKNRHSCVKLLLSAGADFDPRMNGHTAIEWAVIYGNHESVQAIQVHERTSSSDVPVAPTALTLPVYPADVIEDSALCGAAELGARDLVATLLDRGSAPCAIDSKHGTPALHFAAACGHVDVLLLLIERGAQWAHKGNTLQWVS